MQMSGDFIRKKFSDVHHNLWFMVQQTEFESQQITNIGFYNDCIWVYIIYYHDECSLVFLIDCKADLHQVSVLFSGSKKQLPSFVDFEIEANLEAFSICICDKEHIISDIYIKGTIARSYF